MKKEILVAISVAGVLFGLSVSLAAQEKLSLAQCREMALKYNKDMAAANKQTEAARLMSLSYKANFFPNFTAAGIKMLLRGILAVSVSFGGFCFITGMGVFMLGISILCAVFGVYFAKWMGRLFVWCTSTTCRNSTTK